MRLHVYTSRRQSKQQEEWVEQTHQGPGVATVVSGLTMVPPPSPPPQFLSPKRLPWSNACIAMPLTHAPAAPRRGAPLFLLQPRWWRWRWAPSPSTAAVVRSPALTPPPSSRAACSR